MRKQTQTDEKRIKIYVNVVFLMTGYVGSENVWHNYYKIYIVLANNIIWINMSAYINYLIIISIYNF